MPVVSVMSPIRQVGAYAHPCGLELPFAVLKIGALSAIAAARRSAVHIAAPRPLIINTIRKTEIFPDPANRQVAPDHCIVVGVALAANYGSAELDGFFVEHGARLRFRLARKPARNPAAQHRINQLWLKMGKWRGPAHAQRADPQWIGLGWEAVTVLNPGAAFLLFSRSKPACRARVQPRPEENPHWASWQDRDS